MIRDEALKLFICPISGKPLVQAALLVRKSDAPAYQPNLSFEEEREENFTYLICNADAADLYLNSLGTNNFVNPVTKKITKGLSADQLYTVPIFEMRKLLEYLIEFPQADNITQNKIIEDLLKDPITLTIYDCPIIILTNELKIPEPIPALSTSPQFQPSSPPIRPTQPVLHVYSLPSTLEKIITDRDQGSYIDTLRVGKVNFMQLGLHIIKYKPLKKFLNKLGVKASEVLSISRRGNSREHAVNIMPTPLIGTERNQNLSDFLLVFANGFPLIMIQTFLMMGSFERKGAIMVVAEQQRLLQQGRLNVTANVGNYSLIFETLKACVPETICPGFNKTDLMAPLRFFSDQQNQWLNSAESFADIRDLQQIAGKVYPQIPIVTQLFPMVIIAIITFGCSTLDVRWNKKLVLAALVLAVSGVPSLLMTILMNNLFYADLAKRMACGELCFDNLPCIENFKDKPLELAFELGKEIQFCENKLQTYADSAPLDFLHTDFSPVYIALMITTVHAYIQFVGIKNTVNFLTNRLNSAITAIRNIPATLSHVAQQAGRMANNLAGTVNNALGNLYGFWSDEGGGENENNQVQEVVEDFAHPHQN